MNKPKLSFPRIGDYHVAVNYLISHILDVDVIVPSKITTNTIELGSKYSPDFVCTPFKYTLGTFIESLSKGANILIQFGGGCRYGTYAVLQEAILKDLGYDFKLYNFVTASKVNIKRIYNILKSIDKNFKIHKGLYYLYITKNMISQGSQSVVRVSVFYAIVRHTGEKYLAGATAFRFRGPLKQILIRRDTPSV